MTTLRFGNRIAFYRPESDGFLCARTSSAHCFLQVSGESDPVALADTAFVVVSVDDGDDALGQAINYLSPVKLMHVASQNFLAVRTRMPSEADSSCYTVSLEPPRAHTQKKTVFRIVPRFSGVHTSGDSVKLGDDVLLLNPSSNLFLNFSLSVSDTLEVNAGPFKSFWRVDAFTDLSQTSQLLKIGDGISLLQETVGGYLAADHIDKQTMGLAVSVYRGTEAAGLVRMPATASWVIEADDVVPGTPVLWKQSVRIRHVVTDCVLSMAANSREFQLDDPTLKCKSHLFHFVPLVPTDGFISLGSFLRLQHVETGTWLHLTERTAPRCPRHRVLGNDAPCMRYLLQKVVPESTLFFQDVFVIGAIDRAAFSALKQSLAVAHVMQTFTAELVAAKSASASIEVNSVNHCSAQLQYLVELCTESIDSAQRKEMQLMLLDARVAERITPLLNELAPLAATSFELLQLFQLGHHVLQGMMRDNMQAHCAISQNLKTFVQHIAVDPCVATTMMASISREATLVPIPAPIIDVILHRLEICRSPELVDVLTIFCGNGSYFRGKVQHYIAGRALEQFPDIILKGTLVQETLVIAEHTVDAKTLQVPSYAAVFVAVQKVKPGETTATLLRYFERLLLLTSHVCAGNLDTRRMFQQLLPRQHLQICCSNVNLPDNLRAAYYQALTYLYVAHSPTMVMPLLQFNIKLGTRPRPTTSKTVDDTLLLPRLSHLEDPMPAEPDVDDFRLALECFNYFSEHSIQQTSPIATAIAMATKQLIANGCIRTNEDCIIALNALVAHLHTWTHVADDIDCPDDWRDVTEKLLQAFEMVLDCRLQIRLRHVLESRKATPKHFQLAFDEALAIVPSSQWPLAELALLHLTRRPSRRLQFGLRALLRWHRCEQELYDALKQTWLLMSDPTCALADEVDAVIVDLMTLIYCGTLGTAATKLKMSSTMQKLQRLCTSKLSTTGKPITWQQDVLRNAGAHIPVLFAIRMCDVSDAQNYEMFSAAYRFLTQFALRNERNAVALFEHVSLLISQVKVHPGAAETLHAIFANHATLCSQITDSMIRELVGAVAHHPLHAMVLAPLHALVDANGQVQTMAQRAVVKNIMTLKHVVLLPYIAPGALSKIKELLSASGIFQQQQQVLNYIVSMVSLLARCARAKVDFVLHACRSILPLSTVLELILNKSVHAASQLVIELLMFCKAVYFDDVSSISSVFMTRADVHALFELCVTDIHEALAAPSFDRSAKSSVSLLLTQSTVRNTSIPVMQLQLPSPMVSTAPGTPSPGVTALIGAGVEQSARPGSGRTGTPTGLGRMMSVDFPFASQDVVSPLMDAASMVVFEGWLPVILSFWMNAVSRYGIATAPPKFMTTLTQLSDALITLKVSCMRTVHPQLITRLDNCLRVQYLTREGGVQSVPPEEIRAEPAPPPIGVSHESTLASDNRANGQLQAQVSALRTPDVERESYKLLQLLQVTDDPMCLDGLIAIAERYYEQPLLSTAALRAICVYVGYDPEQRQKRQLDLLRSGILGKICVLFPLAAPPFAIELLRLLVALMDGKDPVVQKKLVRRLRSADHGSANVRMTFAAVGKWLQVMVTRLAAYVKGLGPTAPSSLATLTEAESLQRNFTLIPVMHPIERAVEMVDLILSFVELLGAGNNIEGQRLLLEHCSDDHVTSIVGVLGSVVRGSTRLVYQSPRLCHRMFSALRAVVVGEGRTDNQREIIAAGIAHALNRMLRKKPTNVSEWNATEQAVAFLGLLIDGLVIDPQALKKLENELKVDLLLELFDAAVMADQEEIALLCLQVHHSARELGLSTVTHVMRNSEIAKIQTKLLKRQIGSVEIVNSQDKVDRVYFRIPALCRYLTDHQRLRVLERICREESKETPIVRLCKASDDHIFQMEQNQRHDSWMLHHLLNKVRWLYRWAPLFMAVLVNVLMLVHFYAFVSGGQIVVGSVNADMPGVIVAMGLVMLGLLLLRFVMLLIRKSHPASRRGWKSIAKRERLSRLERTPKFVQSLITVGFVLAVPRVFYTMAQIALIICGLIVSPMFYSLMLLDLMYLSPRLRQVLHSVSKNWVALVVVGLLAAVFLYLFAVFQFTFLSDIYVTRSEGILLCDTLYKCFLYNLYFRCVFVRSVSLSADF
eukprot:TRINITY_DN2989_c0_g3_i2.p1 TRINITY_DN2989_c0_g3~~TRINITY_DN2989_c0_g3_i2.p1  ORF type:complete len:2125 (-),score=451.44 TRINITY_DN2989_c0_g3_i2:2366-8740(-)